MAKHATSVQMRNGGRVALALALMVLGSGDGFAQVVFGTNRPIVDDPCPVGNYVLSQRLSSTLVVLKAGPKPDLVVLRSSYDTCGSALGNSRALTAAVEDFPTAETNAFDQLDKTFKAIDNGKVLSHQEQKKLSKEIEASRLPLTFLQDLLGPAPLDACAGLQQNIKAVIEFLDKVEFLDSALSPARTMGDGTVFGVSVVPSAEVDEVNGQSLMKMDRVDASIMLASTVFAVTKELDVGVTAGGIAYSRADAMDGSEGDTLVGTFGIDARWQVLDKGEAVSVAVDAGALFSGGLAGGNDWSGRVGASIDRVFSPEEKRLTVVPFGSTWITLRDGQTGYGLLGAVRISGSRYGTLIGAEALWNQVANDGADDYLDFLVGGRVRLRGGSGSEKNERVDLEAIYRRPLGDEGALPSAGYFLLTLQVAW